jgi:hypothetical protein
MDFLPFIFPSVFKNWSSLSYLFSVSVKVQVALAELRQFQKQKLKKMRGKEIIGEGEITTIRNESPVKEYQGKVVIVLQMLKNGLIRHKFFFFVLLGPW